MDKAFVIEAFANMGYTALDIKEMFNKNGYNALSMLFIFQMHFNLCMVYYCS